METAITDPTRIGSRRFGRHRAAKGAARRAAGTSPHARPMLIYFTTLLAGVGAVAAYLRVGWLSTRWLSKCALWLGRKMLPLLRRRAPEAVADSLEAVVESLVLAASPRPRGDAPPLVSATSLHDLLGKTSSSSDIWHPATEPTPRAHWRHVLTELQETEASYAAALAQLQAMKAALQGACAHDDIRTIFGNVEEVAGVSEALLARLGDAARAADDDAALRATASAFELLSPFLRTYAAYCANYFGALHALRRARRQQKAQARLASLQSGCGVTLDALLIMPVQRLCRYPLLLRELVGALPGHMAGAATALARAAELVEQTSAEVNEKVREAEQRARLVVVSRELTPSPIAEGLVAPSRRLHLCVDLTIADPPAEPKPTRLYLFTDRLLLATPAKATKLPHIPHLFTAPAERFAPMAAWPLERLSFRRLSANEARFQKDADATLVLRAPPTDVGPAPPPPPEGHVGVFKPPETYGEARMLLCASAAAAAELYAAFTAARAEIDNEASKRASGARKSAEAGRGSSGRWSPLGWLRRPR